MSIGTNIKRIRREKGITQEKLAELLGLTPSAISQWETDRVLPDICQIPKLCEVLGVSSDTLLNVNICSEKDDCLKKISEYAGNVGEIKAAFEASRACITCLEETKGSALIAEDGIHISSSRGYDIVVSGKEIMTSILNTPMETIQKICGIISNPQYMKVMSVLDFEIARDENQISSLLAMEKETVEKVLFQLLKDNIVESCENGKYVFGISSYKIFAVLAAVYLDSSKGRKDITSITKSITYGN